MKVCIVVDVGKDIAFLWLWLTNLCDLLDARDLV